MGFCSTDALGGAKGKCDLFISISTVQIIKVLGEGGFSFVYLAQDEHSGVSYPGYSIVRTNLRRFIYQRQFALKKIRCPTGAQGVKEAMREVEAYRRFKCVFSFDFPGQKA